MILMQETFTQKIGIWRRLQTSLSNTTLLKSYNIVIFLLIIVVQFSAKPNTRVLLIYFLNYRKVPPELF